MILALFTSRVTPRPGCHLQLLLLLRHCNPLAGAFVPAGGASHIAAAMIPAIEAAGGAVVTSADVTGVIVQSGRAMGVRLADGREISAHTVSCCTPVIELQGFAAPRQLPGVGCCQCLVGYASACVTAFKGP
jgi:all-trans-retinol 13,14-reductase